MTSAAQRHACRLCSYLVSIAMRTFESLHPSNISCTPLEKSATPFVNASLLRSIALTGSALINEPSRRGRKKLESPVKHVKQPRPARLRKCNARLTRRTDDSAGGSTRTRPRPLPLRVHLEEQHEARGPLVRRVL